MKLIQLTDKQRREVQEKELLILKEIDRICSKENIKYSVCAGTLIGAIRHKGFIPWDDDIDVFMLRDEYMRFREACKKQLGGQFFYQNHDTDPEYYYLFDKIRLNDTVFKESYIAKYKIHHGVYVDVFPLDAIPDNRFLFTWQYLRFQFNRLGVHAKYMDLEARSGKKKKIFSILRALYSPFSLEKLYRRAQAISVKYNGAPCREVCSFHSTYHTKDRLEKSICEELQRQPFEDMEVWIPSRCDGYLRGIYGDYMQLPPEEKRHTQHNLAELSLGETRE